MKNCTCVNRQRLRGSWLLLLCLVVFLSCSGSQVPEQLIGNWKSDHELYQNCFMQIEEKWIVFGNEEQKTGMGMIQKVTLLEKNSKRVVRIKYNDLDGTEFTVNLVYSNNANDSIWFENKPAVIWKRTSLPKAW
jgi:hypothetical protein